MGRAWECLGCGALVQDELQRCHRCDARRVAATVFDDAQGEAPVRPSRTVPEGPVAAPPPVATRPAELAPATHVQATAASAPKRSGMWWRASLSIVAGAVVGWLVLGDLSSIRGVVDVWMWGLLG
jgi:hypothetical protein